MRAFLRNALRRCRRPGSRSTSAPGLALALCLVIALAVALTLARPESGAAQAQEKSPAAGLAGETHDSGPGNYRQGPFSAENDQGGDPQGSGGDDDGGGEGDDDHDPNTPQDSGASGQGGASAQSGAFAQSGASGQSGVFGQSSASAQSGASAQSPVAECHNLRFEAYPERVGARNLLFAKVGNRTDEAIANVKVEIKGLQAIDDDDDRVNPSPKVVNPPNPFIPDYPTGVSTITGGTAWIETSGDYLTHWQLPIVPAGKLHEAKFIISGGVNQIVSRVSWIATMERRDAGTGDTLCRTNVEFWTLSVSSTFLRGSATYYISKLAIDDPYPAAGGDANFEVEVTNVAGSGSLLSVAVRHTSGLEFQQDSNGQPKPPVIAPTPTSPRTLALASWRNYDADKGVGEFYIGNEGVRNSTTVIHSVTLPLKLKPGAVASEQCVTATVTGSHWVSYPYVEGEGDDPSDNTATVCLGESAPLLQDGDSADLLSLNVCDGNTQQTGWARDPAAYPCKNTQSTDLGIELTTDEAGQVNSAPPDKVNAVVRVNPLEGAVINTHWSSVNTWCVGANTSNCTWTNNSDKVSFATAGNLGSQTIEKGAELSWTTRNSNGQYSNWGKLGRIMSVSGLPAGGFSAIGDQYGTKCATVDDNTVPSGLPTLTDPPGGMMYLFSGGNVEFRQRPAQANDSISNLRRPRNKRWNWTITNFSDDDTSYARVAEFGNLGTYVVDFHYSLTRSSGASRYCDTTRAVFHVGPVAELSAADGGVNTALGANQVAYTLRLTNNGPDPSVATKGLVELPAGVTGVTTVPANLGTFHAAGTTGGVAHGPYWTWDVGAQSEVPTTLNRRDVSLIVNGAKAGDKAKATVSNGNGSCKLNNTTLPFVIRTEDCAALNDLPGISGAAWTAANPYKLCLLKGGSNTSFSEARDSNGDPYASETACLAHDTTKTNEHWFTGTVLDHYQDNNTATLTARSGGGAGLDGVSDAETVVRSSLILNWLPTADIIQYRIFRSDDGTAGSYQLIKKVDGDTLTYTDEAVTAGETYHYRVEAVHLSQRLAEIYATSATATLTATTPRAPGTVGRLTAARTTADENVINVNWTAPSNATAATRYDVQYQSRTGNSGNWPTDWTSGAVEQAGTTYTLSEAGGGTSYRFRVRGVTVVGMDSYAGSWSSATVSAVSAPNQVSSLTAARNATTLTTINVAWAAPSGGTTPTRYEVQYREDGGAWLPSTPVSQTGLAYTYINAKGASTYQFRVRTVTVSGGDTIYGGWKSSGTVSRVSAPRQVTGLTARRNAADLTKIDVSWNPPSGGTPATGYEVEYRETSENWPTTPHAHNVTPTCDANNNPQCTFQLPNTEGNSAYQFRVKAVTAVSDTETLAGSWYTSGTVSQVSAPRQVGTVTATRKSDYETKIDVAWSAPGSGTPPSTYDVQYKQDNASDWTDAPNGTGLTDTSYQLSNAAGGSKYVFQVRGVVTLTSTNEKLEGSWRSSNTVRGLPAGPVTNLTATRNTTDKTTIDLSWDASARATGYDVQYRKNNGGWSTAVTGHTGTTYTQTDAGGVESYTFRVRGVSDAGNGDWTESDEVGPPPLEWQGYEVGPQVADGKMAWITLKMTSGPWWYSYRNHAGEWSGCIRVAAGSATISNLRAPITYLVDIFDAAGCADADKLQRENITTIDVPDPILDGSDFNYHTHKRRWPAYGELGVKPSDCSSVEQHSHDWPGGGGGQHWHCPIYR